MKIRIGMLVSQPERQIRYKKIVDELLYWEWSSREFVFFTSLQELNDTLIIKRCRVDMLILQATSANCRFSETLRETNRHCVIIYTAKNMDYVLKAICSMPAAYIPSEGKREYSLTEAIIKVSQYLKKVRTEVVFETKSEVFRFSLSEIDYFESQYRIVHIFKSDGSHETVSSKLDNIQDRNLAGFARCHQSFLVNMGNISRIDKTARIIWFYSGQSVPSSKSMFTSFLEEYRRYQQMKTGVEE